MLSRFFRQNGPPGRPKGAQGIPKRVPKGPFWRPCSIQNGPGVQGGFTGNAPRGPLDPPRPPESLFLSISGGYKGPQRPSREDFGVFFVFFMDFVTPPIPYCYFRAFRTSPETPKSDSLNLASLGGRASKTWCFHHTPKKVDFRCFFGRDSVRIVNSPTF